MYRIRVTDSPPLPLSVSLFLSHYSPPYAQSLLLLLHTITSACLNSSLSISLISTPPPRLSSLYVPPALCLCFILSPFSSFYISSLPPPPPLLSICLSHVVCFSFLLNKLKLVYGEDCMINISRQGFL